MLCRLFFRPFAFLSCSVSVNSFFVRAICMARSVFKSTLFTKEPDNRKKSEGWLMLNKITYTNISFYLSFTTNPLGPFQRPSLLTELLHEDLSKNNITNIFDNNFRGQDNLHELDLSKNKISITTSSTFHHLGVST